MLVISDWEIALQNVCINNKSIYMFVLFCTVHSSQFSDCSRLLKEFLILGYEYKVASLGKRVFAEFIDFVFSYFLMYSLFLLY